MVDCRILDEADAVQPPTILLGTMAGVTLLVNLPRQAATLALGVFVLAFAIYSLVRHPDAQRMLSTGWAYVAGFIGGITSTLFGAGGPPYAMYLSQRGLCCHPTSQFRQARIGEYRLS